MLLTEMLLVALESIRSNLFRAILTMLGIIIGVASVITVVGIGSGARAAVDEQIEALGASVLSIRAGTRMHMGVAGGATLTVKDAEAVAADTPGIRAVVPKCRSSCRSSAATGTKTCGSSAPRPISRKC